MTDRESNPRPMGASSGDSTTHLKRSAVMSGSGIHRLIYRDICVERGASYAACAAHNRNHILRNLDCKIQQGWIAIKEALNAKDSIDECTIPEYTNRHRSDNRV